MRISLNPKMDTKPPAILEQWFSEVSVEEESATKKVRDKLKVPLFTFICK